MNISHPLVFSPRTSFNETISSSDARGAILIGIASTIIGSCLNSIAERLLAHKPGRDIFYDKWLRNMIFQTGFSKNLLAWLRGSDSLRQPHYYDNRKPVCISRVIIPLALRIIVLGVSMALVILSIPRDAQFSSNRGVGIKAYLGGNGTESIAMSQSGCNSFRRNPGRFTQAFDLQLCVTHAVGLLQSNQSIGAGFGLLAISISKDRSFLIVLVGRNGTLAGSAITMPITGQTQETRMVIGNLVHQKIGSIVRNAYGTAGCRMADQAVSNSADENSYTSWNLEDCRQTEMSLARTATQALVGSIYVSTNNTETQVIVPSEETETSPVVKPTKFNGAIVVASEPILGVDTLLVLAGMAILVDVVLSFIKPGESDYLSVVAPLVREMAGVDCLDNPLQAEKGHVIRFARVVRGVEGHVGYGWKNGDIPVEEFAKGTVVRASASAWC